MDPEARAQADRALRDARRTIEQYAQQWLNTQASQRAEQIAQTQAPPPPPNPLTWDVYSDIETRAHAAGLATDRLARRAPSFFRFTGTVGAALARDTVGTGFKKAKPLPLPD
jgi:hypothetical protein